MTSLHANHPDTCQSLCVLAFLEIPFRKELEKELELKIRAYGDVSSSKLAVSPLAVL